MHDYHFNPIEVLKYAVTTRLVLHLATKLEYIKKVYIKTANDFYLHVIKEAYFSYKSTILLACRSQKQGGFVEESGAKKFRLGEKMVQRQYSGKFF